MIYAVYVFSSDGFVITQRIAAELLKGPSVILEALGGNIERYSSISFEGFTVSVFPDNDLAYVIVHDPEDNVKALADELKLARPRDFPSLIRLIRPHVAPKRQEYEALVSEFARLHKAERPEAPEVPMLESDLENDSAFYEAYNGGYIYEALRVKPELLKSVGRALRAFAARMAKHSPGPRPPDEALYAALKGVPEGISRYLEGLARDFDHPSRFFDFITGLYKRKDEVPRIIGLRKLLYTTLAVPIPGVTKLFMEAYRHVPGNRRDLFYSRILAALVAENKYLGHAAKYALERLNSDSPFAYSYYLTLAVLDSLNVTSGRGSEYAAELLRHLEELGKPRYALYETSTLLRTIPLLAVENPEALRRRLVEKSRVLEARYLNKIAPHIYYSSVYGIVLLAAKALSEEVRLYIDPRELARSVRILYRLSLLGSRSAYLTLTRIASALALEILGTEDNKNARELLIKTVYIVPSHDVLRKLVIAASENVLDEDTLEKIRRVVSPERNMRDPCEERLTSAIFGHINMFVTGILEALGDPTIIGAIFKPGLKRQFELLVKFNEQEFPNDLEGAVKIINEFAHGCHLIPIEPKEDAPQHVKIVAAFEDEHHNKADIKRAVENFGAKTAISECIFLLISRVLTQPKLDYVLRLYEKDGLYHARLYIVEVRFFMDPNRPVRPPIYQTASFRFESVEQMESVMRKGARFPKDKTGEYVYTRGSNPNVRSLENRIAELEQARDAVVFASGMAAIASTLFSMLESGSRVLLVGPAYGDTHILITRFLARFGVRSEVVPVTEVPRISGEYDAVFLEAVTNPTLRVPAVDELEGTLIIDNTFVTPIYYEALKHAYVVVASLTKFMSGHSDALGGYAASNSEELIEELRYTLFLTGAAIDPFAARLIERGLLTLRHRLDYDRHAIRLVEELLDLGFAARYPMHREHPDYDVARRLLRGFTGIVAVDVMDGRKAVEITNALAKEFRLAPSFGAPETLVELPRRLSHAFMDPAEKLRLGITPGLIRISLGFSDPERDVERIVEIFKVFS